MELASDTAVANQFWIQQRLENTQDIIKEVSSSLAAQVLVVRNTETMLAQLVDMITREFRSSWRALSDIVAKALYVLIPNLILKDMLTSTQCIHPADLCCDPRDQKQPRRT
jgi:uncharacterized hydantoinase/oxoprolinase family protein